MTTPSTFKLIMLAWACAPLTPDGTPIKSGYFSCNLNYKDQIENLSSENCDKAVEVWNKGSNSAFFIWQRAYCMPMPQK